MKKARFLDGNIKDLIDSRAHSGINKSLQMHSSYIQRLSLERELEGHPDCVSSMAWNSKGSLLISASDDDDTQVNIWSYTDFKLLRSFGSGHTDSIFCTKFLPETSDEKFVTGAGDFEVRIFNLSRVRDMKFEGIETDPVHFRCHTKSVNAVAVEAGNPNMVWSASEDGTLRQYDIREDRSCHLVGASDHRCHHILLDLRCGAKTALADPPRQSLALRSFDISPTQPYSILVGGSDAFARLYDRRMLPSPSQSMSSRPPQYVDYFCPLHLSTGGQSASSLTHVTFSPDGKEILLSYGREHIYLMEVNPVIKQRYIGHLNQGIEKQQATFLGQRGEYIVSGSNDGSCFIWERKTGRLVKVLAGDETPTPLLDVNCVQCHPHDCVVATSGIGSTDIKIWSPIAVVPSTIVGRPPGFVGIPTAANVMLNNEQSLHVSRD